MKLKLLYNENIFKSNMMVARKFYQYSFNKKIILDVGCGVGDVSKGFCKTNEVHGIDISIKNLRIAEQRDIITKKCNIEDKFPYKSDIFDIVICSEVIEHLFDPENTIRESYRVLKKGGMVLLSTPNFYSFINRIKILSGRHRGIELPDYAARQHIRFYSQTGLKELLCNAGFKIIKQEGIGFHPLKPSRKLEFIEHKFKTLCDNIFIEAIK